MLRVIAIKDMKAGIFFPPTSMKTVVEAQRSFAQVSNEAKTIFNNHPNDFRLFHIGDFDEETGEITMLKHHADLGSSADHLSPQNQNSLPFPNRAGSN